MSDQRIVLEFVGDPRGLKPAADAIRAIGGLTKEQQAAFDKANQSFKKLGTDGKKVAQSMGDVTNKAKGIPQELDKAKKSLGETKKGADNLGQSFKRMGTTLLAAFGVTSGVFMFAKFLKGLVDINKEFEFQMAKVKAVTGATDEEFRKLSENARKLGATTKYTATEVGQLSEEYAKLGFTTNEIIAASEATLLLAEATGTDLANAASVVGSVLRAFGLDAEETARVADVMASSFSKSALNIEVFSESMKYVAPIAKAANIDIETTTALLAKLADSGLKGSIAGTGLKNLLSKLSDANSDLSKELGFSVKNSDDLFTAFQKLKDGNIDLTKATELTDERSKAAFLTLIEGADTLEDFTIEMYKAKGATEEMAKVMRDTLKGDLDQLGAAWEAFNLQLGNTQGLRTATQWLTSYLQLTIKVLQSQDDIDKLNILSWADSGAKDAKRFAEETTNAIKAMQLLEKTGQAVPNSGLFLGIEATKGKIAKLTEELKEFEEFIEKQTQGGMFRMMTSEEIDKLSGSTKKYALAAKQAFVDAQKGAAGHKAELEGLSKFLETLEKQMASLSIDDDVVASSVRSLDSLQKELKKLKDDFKDAEIGSKEFYAAEDGIRKKTEEIADVMAQFLVKGSIPEMTYQIKKLQQQQAELADSDAWGAVEKQIQALNDKIKEFKDLTEAGTLAALEKQLSDLKAKEKDLSSPEAWKVWKEEVDDLTLTIRDFKGELEDLANEFIASRTTGAYQQAIRAEEDAWNEVFAAIMAINTETVDEEAKKNALLEEARRAHHLAMLEITSQYLAEDVAQTKKAEAEKKAARDAAIQDFIQISGAAFQGIFDTQLKFIGFEMDALERQLAAGQISRETYAKKRSELMYKQATVEKQAALFKAIVNTAAAVATALTAGPVAGQILAGITAVLGGIEIATIASTPVPQFHKGTKDAPAGFKWVGEKGAELIYDDGGYPIITHRESKIISTDPYSKEAASIRKKYDIPKLDVGLFQPSMSIPEGTLFNQPMSITNQARKRGLENAARGSDGRFMDLDYGRLASALAGTGLNEGEMFRLMRQQNKTNAQGYEMMSKALRTPKRGNYA